jgi:hypothetical protein
VSAANHPATVANRHISAAIPLPRQRATDLSSFSGSATQTSKHEPSQSMDGRQPEYSQTGLNSPYPTFPQTASEVSSADQASAAQYPPQGQDPRASNFSASATPSSEYAQINPSSARSGSFPEYIQRSYQSGAQGAAAGGMAQPQSPSLPLHDGSNNDHQQNQPNSSDSEVPIDPSIAAASSPTYPQHQQYSPYTPHHDMQHYPGHPSTPMYASRPEWAGQYAQPGVHYGHPSTSGPPAPAMVSPIQRPPTVGNFSHAPGRVFYVSDPMRPPCVLSMSVYKNSEA